MKHKYSILMAILAAILFGASTPLLKLTSIHIEPLYSAAFLYCGSGGIYIFYKVLGLGKQNGEKYSIDQNDIKWLIGAILFGGIAAPISLLMGLNSTPAATATLLLNFELVFSVLIAVIFFSEVLDAQAWLAIVLISLASIILAWNGSFGISAGSLGVIIACAFWGFDNNFTKKIASINPFVITSIKGIVGGLFSIFLAVSLGIKTPSLGVILEVLAIGLLCFGISIALYITAMRSIGTARASSYFASAPFAGTILALIIFRQLPDNVFLLAFVIMLFGVGALLFERHRHIHMHGLIEHMHYHDANDSMHVHKHN